MAPDVAERNPSSVLYKNPEGTVLVVDIPRSIEEAQVPPGETPSRRILSAEPLAAPYPTPEPKGADTRRHDQAPAALLADLMAGDAVQHALDVVAEDHAGVFCLPRVTALPAPPSPGEVVFSPELSTYLDGTVEERVDEFARRAPVFDLIVLDPPWPNRSAKRKRGGYETLAGLPETRELLSRIPISSHLAPDGLVALWITNKPSIAELLTSPGSGTLASWGLQVAAERTWLKITSEGEPLYPLDSTWRKPWERLVIAKRIGSNIAVPEKVVLAVPDLHSRKPALRGLFQDLLPPGYCGLEVFARNLTAGWWSWGNEVLRFQQPECWVDVAEAADGARESPPHEDIP